MIVTISNIKVFFHLTPKKMKNILAGHEIEDVDINDAANVS